MPPFALSDFSTWSIADIAKAILIIAGVVGVVFVVLRVLQVQPPSWVIHIFWIVAAVFIGILAVGILTRM